MEADGYGCKGSVHTSVITSVITRAMVALTVL